jgi:membrane protein YqaA with SNARE-associated domain
MGEGKSTMETEFSPEIQSDEQSVNGSIAVTMPGGEKGRVRRFISGFVAGVKALDARQWRKIIITLTGFAAVTVAFMYASQWLFGRFNLPLETHAGVCYLCVLGTFFVANFMLFTPLPIAMTVLVTAAMLWNPAIVGIAAGVGVSLGEMNGYVAGRVGRKLFFRENFMCSINARFCNSRLSKDLEKHGPVAVGVLSFQPVLPFDIAGILAGSLKMNVFKFFGAMLVGKTGKYILIAYFAGVLSNIPFFHL